MAGEAALAALDAGGSLAKNSNCGKRPLKGGLRTVWGSYRA